MTIYRTPYDRTTRLCTGPSVDSGFATLAQALESVGPCPWPGVRCHTYADVAYSDFPLRIDDVAAYRKAQLAVARDELLDELIGGVWSEPQDVIDIEDLV